MFNYVTLDEINAYVNTKSDTDAAVLLECAAWAKAIIDEWKGRRYDVRYETRVYDTPETPSSAFGSLDGIYATGSMPKLRLGNDLLELVRLTNGDGEDFETSEFVLEPANEYPKTRIKLRGGSYWLESENGPEQAIAVTGFWGAHDRYQDAWKNSQVLGAELNASSLSISLAAIGDLQAGQLLRIEDELNLVISIEHEADYTLEVERGFNGTSAVTHASGTQIRIFQPMGTIKRAAMRLVKWMYSQRDTDNFDKTYIVGTGTVSIPTNLPSDVVMALGARGRAS